MFEGVGYSAACRKLCVSPREPMSDPLCRIPEDFVDEFDKMAVAGRAIAVGAGRRSEQPLLVHAARAVEGI